MRRRSFLCALLPGSPLALAASARAQGPTPVPVRFGGTGVGLAALEQVFAGRAELRFMPNLGTSGGLRAAAAGAIDIALSARPPNAKEAAAGLVGRELFRTPFVFAVHAAVPVSAISLAEVAALYAGRTTQWPGGAQVRLVLRPASDSDTLFMKSVSHELAEAVTLAHARPGSHVAPTDTDASESLERIPGALGITTLALARAEQRNIRMLDLDGVSPSVEALAAGRYRHRKSVYLVVHTAARPEVKAVAAELNSAPVVERLASLGCLVTAAT